MLQKPTNCLIVFEYWGRRRVKTTPVYKEVEREEERLYPTTS